jgi:hypothetical protein
MKGQMVGGPRLLPAREFNPRMLSTQNGEGLYVCGKD